jgi:hypothetical protein
VLLAAEDELTLGALWLNAHARGLRVVPFHEPDLDHELTAVAFEPAGHRLVAHLPLALDGRREVRT